MTALKYFSVSSSFPLHKYHRLPQLAWQVVCKDAQGCTTVETKLLPLLLPRWSLKHVGIPVLENLHWHHHYQEAISLLWSVWPSYAFKLLTEWERSCLQSSWRSSGVLNHLSTGISSNIFTTFYEVLFFMSACSEWSIFTYDIFC